MNEIIGIILEYAAIWVPSIVAVSGVVCTILVALNKTKEAWEKLRGDTDFKSMKEQLITQSQENQELIKCNKALVDNITKIKDYVDHKED